MAQANPRTRPATAGNPILRGRGMGWGAGDEESKPALPRWCRWGLSLEGSLEASAGGNIGPWAGRTGDLRRDEAIVGMGSARPRFRDVDGQATAVIGSIRRSVNHRRPRTNDNKAGKGLPSLSDSADPPDEIDSGLFNS